MDLVSLRNRKESSEVELSGGERERAAGDEIRGAGRSHIGDYDFVSQRV